MKIIKKIVFVIVVVFILSSIGGYYYFDKKFTPPQNYLKVSGVSENLIIKWVSNNDNPYAALLLPVQIKGIEKQFYMQLDFGSPITMFYKNSLQSVQTVFRNQIVLNKNSNQIALHFILENMQVSSDMFKLLDYGDKVNFEDKNANNIIGTIGTDLLEKRIIIVDFKKGICSFKDKMLEDAFSEFEFKKRKILIPAKIGNESLKLLYDSGTSGYELITNKSEWEKYKIKNSKIKTHNGNSWGNTLTVISAPANQEIKLGNRKLKLSEVTYIEGTSKIQNILMKLSGMQGMIGNKILLNNKIILDCKNEKFKIE